MVNPTHAGGSMMRFSLLLLGVASANGACAYWLQDIPHQGFAPFAGPGYSVFRNVKDYGAKGDGVTDDSAAINAAIAAGSRCGRGCKSSTVTPALVYFPAGTYMVASSILPFYYTQMIGDPTSPPTIKATAGFQNVGMRVIDADPYYSADENYDSTDVFFRQIRNFVIDTTAVPASTAIVGLHFPTAQATSLQNIVFDMATAADNQHTGLFIENGSAGFVADLMFNGGLVGAAIGNQQYTMRNLTFNNCVTAIHHYWDWGWTYQGITINNCGTGIDMSGVNKSTGALSTGSVTLLDSSMTNVGVGVRTAWTTTSQPATAGSLVLENLVLTNVAVAVGGSGNTILAGSDKAGTVTVAGWAVGHRYAPSGPVATAEDFSPPTRPPSLLSGTGNRYYTRSKPQYATFSASSFISLRSAGARGDSVTDDTAALQGAINTATAQGKAVWLDYGLYRVTSTITVPPGAVMVGESYPVILSSGPFFADAQKPQPVLKVGNQTGQPGRVELSDFVVSTQKAQPGAVLIEWNLASATTGTDTPSGMWDVHARIGGFVGTQLQTAQCLKMPSSSQVNQDCIAAYMGMHVTPAATGLYMENAWIWVADHDIDDASLSQVSIYAPRGLYIESTVGTFWLYGTAVEHFTFYQYQLSGTKNILMGQIQTETPYYQPDPPAPAPFEPVPSLRDPDFSTSCRGGPNNCAAAWGLRIIDSQDVIVYGAGLYSFFDNYSTACSTFAAGQSCQARIASVEGPETRNVNIYNLNTIGAQSMLDRDGVRVAYYDDNVNVFPSNLVVYLSG